MNEDLKRIAQLLIQQAVAFNDMATQLATLSRTMLYNVSELERIVKDREEEDE